MSSHLRIWLWSWSSRQPQFVRTVRWRQSSWLTCRPRVLERSLRRCSPSATCSPPKQWHTGGSSQRWPSDSLQAGWTPIVHQFGNVKTWRIRIWSDESSDQSWPLWPTDKMTCRGQRSGPCSWTGTPRPPSDELNPSLDTISVPRRWLLKRIRKRIRNCK